MILSDLSIRELLGRLERPLRIEPLGPGAIQPASVDVRLGSGFVTVLPREPFGVIVPGDPKSFGTQTVVTYEPFVLPPGGFCLASTLETVVIPDDLVARVEGKSTIARAGIAVHVTAGYIDPGFRGTITLELVNQSAHMVSLRPGMPIAQLSFHTLTTRAERPYGADGLGSRYQDQTDPTPGRESVNTPVTSFRPTELVEFVVEDIGEFGGDRTLNLRMREPVGTPAASFPPPEMEDFSVDDLGLSNATLHRLKRKVINRTRQLASLTADEVLGVEGIGPIRLREIQNRLADQGVLLLGETARPPEWVPMPDVRVPHLDDQAIASWLNRRNPPDRLERLAALGFALHVTGKSAGDLTVRDVEVIKSTQAGHNPVSVQRYLDLVRQFLRHIGVITYPPRTRAPSLS